MTTLGDPPPNSSNNARTDRCQKAAEDLWNEAIQSLSEDDQQRLASLRNDKLDILNAVLDEVEIKKQRCLDKRWTYKGRDGKPKVLRDLCDKTIAWVTKFKALGDTFVKFDVSGQAALPWAGVAFLLQVASNESRTFGRMLEGVERVSFLITRYALVEHAYFSPSGASDALMDHVGGDEKSALKGDMVMLYSSILRFLAQASGYYSGNTAKRFAKSLIETPESAVDDSFDEIMSKENEISRTQHLLQQSSLSLLYKQGSDTRLAVEHLRGLEDPINRVAAQLSDIQDRLKVEDRTKLLMWLSTIPHERHHASKKSTRLNGSGEWLLRDPEFLDWEKSSSSSILWVHGMPGCGKSYLLSFFVDHVTEKSPSQRPLTAFFYCSRNEAEPERQDATSIMRSLLKQLCSDSANEPIRDPVASTFKQRQEVAESRGQEIEPLSLEESTSQIIDVLSLRQDPAFIILDALDECNVDSVHDLLDALERILQEAAGLTKIFLTSRDDGDIRNRLEGITNVYIDASNNSDDINRFIDAEVDKAISRRRLLGGRVSTSLKDEILTTLKDKAGGMFRWVSLQLQHICNPRKFKIPEAVRDELGKFPATLKESYGVIYNQILDYDDRTRQVAERAISLLLTLQHSLSNEAFISAVCAGYDDELDEMTLLDICCNLITCDNGFRFVHLSAQEFVLQRPEYSAAHLRNVVPARACLSVFFSSKQSSCPHEHRRYPGLNNGRYICWIEYACIFLGEYLSILDASLATATGPDIEDSVRSMIRRFLLLQPDVDDSPFQRWKDTVDKMLADKVSFLQRRFVGIRHLPSEPKAHRLPGRPELHKMAAHPILFMTGFNLKILPVQAGILVPCNGKPDEYLPRRFEPAHDGAPQTLLSKFLEMPRYHEWYLFLAVHGLCIAKDIAPGYIERGKLGSVAYRAELQYSLRFPQFMHLKTVPELFQEFLEMDDPQCAEITLLAHPDLMINFDMLHKACSTCPLTIKTRRDLLSRYLRQNHPNGLPNLDMADGLDVMRLVVEKEPQLTGNKELLIDIWRENSDTWSQKTWPLMELLCSRKIDLDLDVPSLFRICGRCWAEVLEITPDRARFLTTLLCQPGVSVRVDEHCLEFLVTYRVKSMLQFVSSLRPHVPINEFTVRDGFRDGYWPTILTHPCPSVSLKDLTIIVIEEYPPDAMEFFLSRNKDIRIDDKMLSTAVTRPEDSVDIFRILVESGRLKSDQISRDVLQAALRKPRKEFPRWVALFLARGWATPKDDIFRVALKRHFEGYDIERQMCQSYSWLAEQGITVKLSDICNGALLDLRISQLGGDAEATVDRYLEFCAKKMNFFHSTLHTVERKLARDADLPLSIFPDNDQRKKQYVKLKIDDEASLISQFAKTERITASECDADTSLVDVSTCRFLNIEVKVMDSWSGKEG